MKRGDDFPYGIFKLGLWLSSVLVFLAVGLAMIDNTLVISFVPAQIASVAGWIIVITTIISALLSVFIDKRQG